MNLIWQCAPFRRFGGLSTNEPLVYLKIDFIYVYRRRLGLHIRILTAIYVYHAGLAAEHESAPRAPEDLRHIRAA